MNSMEMPKCQKIAATPTNFIVVTFFDPNYTEAAHMERAFIIIFCAEQQPLALLRRALAAQNKANKTTV